jgi:hypothetical protein
MVGNIRESGLIITWRGMACILGVMAECTRANTRMIRSMAMGSIHGLTRDSIRGGGSRGSSMD